MKIISPSATILTEHPYSKIKKQLEERGRICYRSEDKITDNSAEKFVQFAIDKQHNTVLEMAVVCVVVPRWSDIKSKYITSAAEICSGSVRAWREYGHQPKEFDTLFPGLFGNCHLSDSMKVAPMPTNDWHHTYVAVRFVVNRAVSHELVRHRNWAILQESQRYCAYNQDRFGNEVTFIKPCFYSPGSDEYEIWLESCRSSEIDYLQLLKTSSPQAARTVLTNSCKTEVICYGPLFQWSHFFAQRTSPAAEPSMREVTIPLLEEFRVKFPGHFDELKLSVGGK